jgi:hypothetical protein
MSAVESSVAPARPVPLWRVVDATAPPERLAMLRILTGLFALVYLVVRLPVFVRLAERDSGFEGVGAAALLEAPVPEVVVLATIVATLASGAAYVLGWRFRVLGPVFAVAFLALGTYRSSWGQLLHFENLLVLHLIVVALAPAADRWSLDARAGRPRTDRDATAYGWPIALAAVIVVITYVITGLAKLRYGGIDWIVGDTLRNHVAYSAARLDLLGGNASPIAGWAVRASWAWTPAAAFAVVVELAAPLALLGGRIRTIWVLAAWLLHAGIAVTMLIVFPYPLFLVAFAPFYRVERLWTDRPAWLRSVVPQSAWRSSASRRPHEVARSASSASR